MCVILCKSFNYIPRLDNTKKLIRVKFTQPVTIKDNETSLLKNTQPEGYKPYFIMNFKLLQIATSTLDYQ